MRRTARITCGRSPLSASPYLSPLLTGFDFSDGEILSSARSVVAEGALFLCNGRALEVFCGW